MHGAGRARVGRTGSKRALGGLGAGCRHVLQESDSRCRRRRARSARSGRQRRAGKASAGARRRVAGARGAAGWAACAHKLGQVGCFGAPDSVFGLVRLSIVRESPNEHCSL